MAQDLVINGETYEGVERLAAKNTEGSVVVYTENGGGGGADGKNGATFFPSVDAAGNLSWTNDGGLANPDPVNIAGPQGPAGKDGSDGAAGAAGTDATINGVNALNIQGGDGIDAVMDGSTLTIKAKNVEEWVFTLNDNSTVTKKVVLV